VNNLLNTIEEFKRRKIVDSTIKDISYIDPRNNLLRL
jgi:hypothetical protein